MSASTNPYITRIRKVLTALSDDEAVAGAKARVRGFSTPDLEQALKEAIADNTLHGDAASLVSGIFIAGELIDREAFSVLDGADLGVLFTEHQAPILH